MRNMGRCSTGPSRGLQIPVPLRAEHSSTRIRSEDDSKNVNTLILEHASRCTSQGSIRITFSDVTKPIKSVLRVRAIVTRRAATERGTSGVEDPRLDGLTAAGGSGKPTMRLRPPVDYGCYECCSCRRRDKHRRTPRDLDRLEVSQLEQHRDAIARRPRTRDEPSAI
jgi:hypothetical protein